MTDGKQEDLLSSKIYAVMTLISFFSFLSFLRFFQKTRMLINYVEVSIVQMSPFFLMMGIIIVAFAVSITFSKGHTTGTLSSFLEHMQGMYKAMYGDYAFFSDDSILSTILFFFWTMLFVLVMMNLLIAIIGNAYSDLSATKEKEDYYALNKIIIELEYFMTYNRTNMQRHHLIYAEYEHGDDLSSYKDNSSACTGGEDLGEGEGHTNGQLMHLEKLAHQNQKAIKEQ